MKHNINTVDRLIRIVISIILAVLFFAGIVEGTLGIIFLIMSAVALVTGLFKFCFVYAIFGIKTCKDEECK
ncbi:MAG: DUF2892 domain-containing protein [Bacteroidales bacterium]|nr:DUF2892 domain-containing protein [Bacteroidales bacterium]